jgi:ribosome-associated protein
MQDEVISKTKRKQEMTALQSLGAQLVALPESQLAEIPMDDPLREAVLEAKRIKSHEAKRRQMQYIGKLMRRLDEESVAAIAAAVDDQ